MTSKATADSGFDRVRPRSATSAAGHPPVADREGKRALFSDGTPEPTGALTLHCRGCRADSTMSWGAAVRRALPSVPLAVPGKGLRLHMKCPACGKRSWVEVHNNN